MTELNENFAPDGMIAVKVDYQKGITCKNCHFYGLKECNDKPCCASERPDKTTVIFVKKETSQNTIEFLSR